MINSIWRSMLTLMIATSVGLAEDVPSWTISQSPKLVLIITGEEDQPWAEGLRRHLEQNIFLATTVRFEPSWTPPMTGSVLDSLRESLTWAGDGEIAIILVEAPRAGEEPPIRILPEFRTAIINQAFWRPAVADQIPMETWRPRVQRLFVYAGARLLGLQVAALPLCASHDDVSAQGLDVKALGLAPPARDELREKLGLPLLPQAP